VAGEQRTPNLTRYLALAGVVLLCGVAAFGYYEGLHDSTPVADAAHTRQIWSGDAGSHWVSADQYQRWRVSWAVFALALVGSIVLAAVIRRSRRGP
jgi:hypothetical protein